MGRRKKRVKIPLTKTKINLALAKALLGLSVILGCGICLLSLFVEGQILSTIRFITLDQFGYPIILFLLSGFMLGIKVMEPAKTKIIKWHWFFGLLFIGAALTGMMRSGIVGEYVFDNLSADFSIIGALVFLSAMLLVGLIIFFDTSLEAMVAFFLAISGYLFGAGGTKEQTIEKLNTDKKPTDDEFIVETKKYTRSSLAQPEAIPVAPTITMRPTNVGSDVQYIYPPLELLKDVKEEKIDKVEQNQNAAIIERTLESFGVKARVEEANTGPTVTQYAMSVVRGTNLNKITNLSNELALSLASVNGTVRIEAPIPGRSLVGIEIPNRHPQLISLKKMVSSSQMKQMVSPLAVPLGVDVAGEVVVADLAQMPHVLIAGTTGSGKSVILNTWITTWLFRARPQDLRLILIDPKRVELSVFANVPHLLTPPIVELEQSASALSWAAKEMDKRYGILQTAGVRSLTEYHRLPSVPENLPYIVICIDELADLMMVAAKEAESYIQRLSQKARAVGIHLVLATQRPSVNVITGTIKANIPSRIAFNVASVIDSKVILDTVGAEKLLGKGDMLYQAPDRPKAQRIQSAFIGIDEVKGVVDFLKAAHPVVHYTEEVTAENVQMGPKGLRIGGAEEEKDALFKQAVDAVLNGNQASASYLQRQLKLGYARAARILDQMEAAGYIGPVNGSKPREIYRRFEE